MNVENGCCSSWGFTKRSSLEVERVGESAFLYHFQISLDLLFIESIVTIVITMHTE